jgi:2-phospho-L-lactate guanylyltransferase
MAAVATGRIGNEPHELSWFPHVGLVVPIKPLHYAKSRLRGAADDGVGDLRAHMTLVLAMVMDTIAAASEAEGVRRVLAVTSDERVMLALRREGVQTLHEAPVVGLNAALLQGERELRLRDPRLQVVAVQADLPALRSSELSAALRASAGRRAYCRDRHGTGTTILLSDHDSALQPRFGMQSAAVHASTGAARLEGPWPSLECDVDTAADLEAAACLGLGVRTSMLLGCHPVGAALQRVQSC